MSNKEEADTKTSQDRIPSIEEIRAKLEKAGMKDLDRDAYAVAMVAVSKKGDPAFINEFHHEPKAIQASIWGLTTLFIAAACGAELAADFAANGTTEQAKAIADMVGAYVKNNIRED
jgi:hypothetical protein